MSDLKNAWEIGMEKSDNMDPESKKRKKLTDKQKNAIAEVRKEFKAKTADKELTLQFKLEKLSDRTPPEELEMVAEKLNKEFAQEKNELDKEMETRVEAIRKQS